MDSEIITLAGALSFFSEDLSVIGKAELKLKSNFLLEFKIEDFCIRAKVRSSMKDKAYSVILNVDGSGGIACAKCECPRGNWICSHMATVAIYANKNGMSKTDLPNSWIKHPKKVGKENIKSLKEIFPSSRKEYSALPRTVEDTDRDFLKQRLLNVNFQCPMTWIAGPEPLETNCAPCVIKDVTELLPIFRQDKQKFLMACQVDQATIEFIAEETKLQHVSQLWGRIRKFRLTGSNFGKVLASCNRCNAKGTYPPSLFKTLSGECDLSGRDVIMWGQMHEETAITAYKTATRNLVEKVGLLLFPCGFLGCSPDGMVLTEDQQRGVLEVKCPWKYRDCTVEQIMEQECKGQHPPSAFYLEKSGTLNPKHAYWHQIQGEIAAANVNWGHFVIWTNKGMKILVVERDNNWSRENLPKLTDFYLNQFLPHLNAKLTPSE